MKPDEAKTAPTEPIDESSRADRPAEPRPTAAGEPASHELATSRVREPGRYRVIGEHGRGGLGRVSRVHDRELGRDVAIKELISRTSTNEARFLREAMITARLEHPAIVPVYEAGRWPDGTPFYAMKLVSGRPLRALIAERRTIAERLQLLHHVIAVADAMAYAHDRNIIHRDLKPANVLVGDFGETVVIDWGLAKDLTEAAASDLTTTGSVLGTPSYMAPEQGRGEQVDKRADVFAIGAMLWELCSLDRVPPREAHHRDRLFRRAGIDRDLAVIIEKALELDPERRYPHAGALAADLKAFKSGARIAARDYTLLAMLAHWPRLHRALAASLAATVALLVTIAIFYIHNVTTARVGAEAALADAQLRARNAVIASATSQLEHDPTAAWHTIAALGGPAPDIALLRARIQAAGIAETTLALPAQIGLTALTPSGGDLVVATMDRTLIVIDLATHAIRLLATSLTEPVMMSASDAYVYVVRKPERPTLTRVSLASGTLDELADLAQLPVDVEAGDGGVFWQDSDGTVHQALPDHRERLVASAVARFAVVDRKLALCSKSGKLTVGEPGRDGSPYGSCMDSSRWGFSSHSFALPTEPGNIAVYGDGSTHNVAFDRERRVRHLGLSDAGLISAVDTLGGGAIWTPGAASFQTIGVTQPALDTSARGSTAAWDFSDGTIRAIDTSTRREWSFHAHADGINCIHVLPGHRLVTCSRNEVRIWTLPRDAPALAAELPHHAFHVAFNSEGTALFDGADGEAYALPRGQAIALALHKHAQPAMAAAWCGELACTASADGHVVCSSPARKAIELTDDFGATVTGLTSAGGHCFAAVASGGVYDIDDATHPIYRHDHEPYQIAASRDGSRIASGDWEGAVEIWDVAQRRVLAARPHLHTGRVIALAWTDDNRLVTAGADGYIRLLGPAFDDIRAWQVDAPVRDLAVAGSSIYSALASGTVWRASLTDGAEDRISLGTPLALLTPFAVSPGGTVAVGAEDGELFIIDPQRRVSVRHFEHDAITCTRFEDERSVLACLWDGRVMRFTITPESFEASQTEHSP